ncbi:uncharacterized protein LOC112342912 [Selaginella moellendorffii]|uniref:uncharacterized protein LOC112342912 n=1 Tax=Selaginella moellendorffii TaxID=88036 RepID=UPI000D1CB396|nr:uncharacterized protein LOC112342912 [Selaginella moellendorffii]|eukprot:XP_024521298.1 uncharacterized protein LOC112342912 [Selaginella moellendorffii]
MGLVAYSRGQSTFLEAIDISSSGKTADNVFATWERGIKIVGEENVVLIVTDGKASNKAAARLLEARKPRIMWAPCLAHCLNNILKDFAKLPWMVGLLDKGKTLVGFLRNHSHLVAILASFSSRQVLKFSETRFAFNFLMMERLVELRPKLQQMFVSDAYNARLESRIDSGIACRGIVFNNIYWNEVNHMLGVSRRVMYLLQMVDGDVPVIEKVYEGMDQMSENIRQQEENNLRYEELNQLISNRWWAYHSTFHSVAYMLDPKFQGRGQEKSREVSKDWNMYLEIQFPNYQQRSTIKNQLCQYRNLEGSFGTGDSQMDRTTKGSVQWWEDNGYSGPDLQRLAIRVLSQASSSSSVERLFSIFGHITSKKRNCLVVSWIADFVFVANNTKLIGSHTSYDKFVGLSQTGSIPQITDVDIEAMEEEDEDEDDDPANEELLDEME